MMSIPFITVTILSLHFSSGPENKGRVNGFDFVLNQYMCISMYINIDISASYIMY